MADEYIEREAATTLFARACGECKEACEEFDGFYADCNQCLLHGVLKEFAAIPAADVAPVVHARWVEDGDNQPMSCDKCYCCSNCHGNRRFEWQLKPFCEDCGADMREAPNDP